MNQTDPLPMGPSWRQVSIQFDDYPAAEHTGVVHLGPQMTNAETTGLVASWFFIRKAPCWRLRFLPSHDSTEQDATTFIHQRLETLQAGGHIAHWVETSYEPEVHAFGGAAAMATALPHPDTGAISGASCRSCCAASSCAARDRTGMNKETSGRA